jgi:hypothetical protein
VLPQLTLKPEQASLDYNVPRFIWLKIEGTVFQVLGNCDVTSLVIEKHEEEQEIMGTSHQTVYCTFSIRMLSLSPQPQ